MGTRGLTCVFKNGECKVAQYGQWDHYPDGAGLYILYFLKNHYDKEKFLKNLDTVSWISDEDFEKTWDEFGGINESGFVEYDLAKKHDAKYPEWSRDTGAEILKMIQENENLKLIDHLSFSGDSLFCEWAYVIDFDKNTFEVYEGFNKNKPLTKEDRFFEYTNEPDPRKDYYYPVRLRQSFSLDDLPDRDSFLEKLERPE